MVYGRSGRPLLTAQIRDRRVQVQHYLHRYMYLVHDGQILNNEHRLLLNLAHSGWAELAGQAMFQHTLGTSEGIARVMERGEGSPL